MPGSIPGTGAKIRKGTKIKIARVVELAYTADLQGLRKVPLIISTFGELRG
tara:strand:+ start:2578 stop:2730 length:153 start_codon:yes stop_codon:yes gene_type:complete